MTPTTRIVHNVSTTRVFPSQRSSPTSIPLSILDSACADFAPCGAVWFFRPPTEHSSQPPFTAYSTDLLIRALSYTLNSYPHFCGTLRHSRPISSFRGHTNRFGRVWVDFGNDDGLEGDKEDENDVEQERIKVTRDPGVEVTTTAMETTLDTLLPPPIAPGIYDGSIPSHSDLLPPSSSLVRLGEASYGGSPGPSVLICLTTFTCGGLSLAIKMHHSLSDAQSLSMFVGDWTSAYRSLSADPSVPPTLSIRPFTPQALDRYAAGDIDSDEIDSQEDELARSLPQLRFDFWGKGDGSPGSEKPNFFKAAGEPHPSIQKSDETLGRQRGERIPWETWDYTARVKDYLIDFTAEEIEACYRASIKDESSVKKEGRCSNISRLDALMARVWKCIVRARDLSPNTKVSIDMSLGLRSRVSPPLPPTFIGSTLVNFSTTLPVSHLLSTSPTQTTTPAQAIREGMSTFTPRSISALLHRMAYALDPVREWNCFMGAHHVMQTSWLRIDSYRGVNLGSGQMDDDGSHHMGRPVLVHAAMPLIDGLVVVMERSGEAGLGSKWYEEGVTIRLMLREDVMNKVIADPELKQM